MVFFTCLHANNHPKKRQINITRFKSCGQLINASIDFTMICEPRSNSDGLKNKRIIIGYKKTHIDVG